MVYLTSGQEKLCQSSNYEARAADRNVDGFAILETENLNGLFNKFVAEIKNNYRGDGNFMKKYLLVFFAAAVVMFASAESALACSCMASPDPEKKQIETAYAGSEAIFAGEVLEVKEAGEHGLAVKIKVSKTWKGSAAQEITVTTMQNSAMCGYHFEVGKKYLVYANASAEKLSTNNCSRTAVYNKKGDAKYLDKLKRKKKSA